MASKGVGKPAASKNLQGGELTRYLAKSQGRPYAISLMRALVWFANRCWAVGGASKDLQAAQARAQVSQEGR